MKLFEINQMLLRCVKDGDNVVDTETGEVIDTEALDALKMEKREKEKNIAMWIKNLDSDAAELKKQKQIFAERQAAAERKRDSLKQYLFDSLAGAKFETPEVKVSYRKSTSVNVSDESLVPEEFLIPQPAKIDKGGIGKALKAGKNVPGCSLVEKQNIQIK